MKKWMGYLLMGLFLVGAPLRAASKEAHIHIKGMVCAFCAQGLTKKFKAQAAVASVKVDLGKKQIDLVFKDGNDVPDAEINSVILDAGYNVEKIER